MPAERAAKPGLAQPGQFRQLRIAQHCAEILLDVDQWIRVAKDAGMKYAMLTAKHTAGYCLWDTKVQFRGKEFDHDVATSGNKTDIIAEFVKACNRYGMTPGLYWCLLDFRNNSVPHGPLRVSWYQGGAMPRSPKSYVDLEKIDHGAMFKGSKGYLVCDFESRLVLPFGDTADLTYYKPRKKEEVLPEIGHFQQQWIDACKEPSRKTACDFEYSSNMIEQMLLGLVACRVGEKIQYDSVAGKVTNCPEANQYLSRKYRDGWTLNG